MNIQQYQEDTLKKFDEWFFTIVHAEGASWTASQTNRIRWQVKSKLKSSLKGQLEVVEKENKHILDLIHYAYGTFKAGRQTAENALEELVNQDITTPLLEEIKT